MNHSHPSHFENLSLIKPILRALSEQGYRQPTAIQQAAIPQVLAGGDLLGAAQTGTGKTAAFSLPILQMLHQSKTPGARHIRALILSPTRELALQIAESLRDYGRHLPLRTAVVLGGVPSVSQIKALRKHPDILVATPGRLLDLFGQGYIKLNKVEMLVLDEADRMLDMGFIHDVRRIVAQLPGNRQTMFFSATLSEEIAQFASGMLKNPSYVEVTPAASVADNIDQKVLFVRQIHKGDLLAGLLKGESIQRALVFTRTKHRANRLSRQLSNRGISADAIHSNKSQAARQRALAAFNRGSIKVLVGTDVVARGIDVDEISHVINYELPETPESYVHRIGRTARAGAPGTALSFCAAEEVAMLSGIEKLTQCVLTEVDDHPFHCSAASALRSRYASQASAQAQPENRPAFGRKKRMARRSRG